VARISRIHLPTKAAISFFMNVCDQAPLILLKMQDQISLMLHWRSFSWWGMEGIAICFAYNGSQKFLYNWLQPIGGVISQDEWPQIVDAPLTVIFMIGQGGSCYLFCLWRGPKIPLWLTTTYRRGDFPGHITKNCWRSVDAHFAMAVSTICNRLIWYSPSFTLFWLPFWRFHLLSSWSLCCSLIIHRYI
jgi:hypothetical protein